jgi:hypothetical protein
VSTFLYLHLICYVCYLKFKKINDDIRRLIISIKKSKKPKSIFSREVKTILNEHDEACLSLFEYNKFWRLVILVIYYGYQPISCMLLLQGIMIKANHSYIIWIIKAANAFGSLFGIFVILMFALSTEMVSTEAFSIYPKLVTLILTSTGKLNVKSRMKLQNMMIRIASEKIGFTCFDLFVLDRKAVHEVC